MRERPAFGGGVCGGLPMAARKREETMMMVQLGVGSKVALAVYDGGLPRQTTATDSSPGVCAAISLVQAASLRRLAALMRHGR